MTVLEKLNPDDEIELLGKKFIVTNKTKGYRIGLKDSDGFIHYLRRETPIRKILKRSK